MVLKSGQKKNLRVLFLWDKKYLTFRIKVRKRRTVSGSGITAVSNAPQSFSFLNLRSAPFRSELVVRHAPSQRYVNFMATVRRIV